MKVRYKALYTALSNESGSVLNYPTQSLRNIFFVIHPSLPASLLSFTSALFSITSPIVHFLLLRMGFWCSDLSCAGRVMDKPPPILTTHSAQLHKHMHARSRSRRHGYPRHHLSAGQWRPEEIAKTLYQAVLPLCLRLLITLLAGGGHSSHNGWYESGDDRALSKSWGGFKLGTSCFERWLIGGYCCRAGAAGLSVRLTAEANGSWWKGTCVHRHKIQIVVRLGIQRQLCYWKPNVCNL